MITLTNLVNPLKTEAKTYLPEEVTDIVDKYAEQYDVSNYLVYALIEVESSGHQYAVSPSGTCKGLTQVNPITHKGRMERLGYTVDQIYEPEANIHTCIDYLAEIREVSGIEFAPYVLDVYNGNSKAMSNYEGGIISKYSKKVLRRVFEFILEDLSNE